MKDGHTQFLSMPRKAQCLVAVQILFQGAPFRKVVAEAEILSLCAITMEIPDVGIG